MIVQSFFRDVLIQPVLDGADELTVIGGYSSAAMLLRHLGGNPESGEQAMPDHVRMQILHGMYSQDGISPVDHGQFLDVSAKRPGIEVRYTGTRPACHIKLYVWKEKSVPVVAFVGSANYSQGAFLGRTVEVLTPCDPNVAEAIAIEQWDRATPIAAFSNVRQRSRQVVRGAAIVLPEIDIPLALASGAMPTASGINWNCGRPDRNDKDAVYLSVSNHSNQPGFFPGRDQIFLAEFDDGVVIKLRTISGKQPNSPIVNYGGIVSVGDYQILGRYLRQRIGNAIGKDLLGKCVSFADLQAYGRTKIHVVPIDESNFYFDFSRP